jgi:5-methylcytosine-specific restriction enzyme A
MIVGKLTNMRPMLNSLPSQLKLPPKQADFFYQSNAWRNLVRRLKKERGPYCCKCGSSDRIIADHIVERSDGGADLDPENIQLLCNLHHAQKTAEARKHRARGQR